MASTDLAAIVKYAGQYDKQMILQTLNQLDVAADMNVINNVSTFGKLLPKLTVEKGIRPLSTTVETRGGIQRTIGGRKLYVYDAMKIIDFTPEELRSSYLSDMVKPGAKQMPFAQWFWQAEFEKIKSEINDSCYLSDYKGDAAAYSGTTVYNAGDVVVFGAYDDFYRANTTTTAGDSPSSSPASWDLVNDVVISTGVGTIIANEITASNITPITTGALTSANALDKIELMFNDIPKSIRNKGGVFRMSEDNFRNYVLAERTEFGPTNTPSDGDGRKFVYGSNKKWEVLPGSWMGSSGRVIGGPANNLNFGTNTLGDLAGVGKTIDTLHGNRSVVKWQQGFEISDLEVLFVNDQA